jgi:acyl dehydratase
MSKFGKVGERRTSEWTRFTQDEINAFGTVTRDVAPFHMDRAWAREHSPFGTTVAYGFQTLSMLTYFNHEIFGWPADGTPADGYALNYGFDRVRFTGPVPVDTPFRCHATLVSEDERNPGQILQTFEIEVEVQGVSQPVLVAQWLGLWVEEEGHARVASAS